MPFRIGKHVHPKAHADAPPPQAPTGIDYLRLIQDRHTRALGERLQYAHLSDPAQQHRPAPPGTLTDDNGGPYDTDLLALAGTSTDTDNDLDNPTPQMAMDPDLEAEPDGFTAPLANTGASTDVLRGTAAPTHLEETQ